jgi:dUTP pyrophosphatase
LLKTGFAVDVPEGYELQLRSRNDLVAKHGIFVTGGILTIEGGEIRVPVSSLSRYGYQIARGDVIARLVLCPVVRCRVGT